MIKRPHFKERNEEEKIELIQNFFLEEIQRIK